MLIDVTLISILIKLGWAAFFGLILAVLLLRRSAIQATDPARARRVGRTRVAAALLLFVVGLASWNSVASRLRGARASSDEDEDAGANTNTTFGDADVDVSFSQAAALGKLGFALKRQHDPSQAQRQADSLVSILKSVAHSTDDLEDLRQEAHELFDTNENVVVRAAIDSAFGPRPTDATYSNDSLAAAYAAALQAGQSAQADALADSLAEAVAGNRLRALRQELNDEARKSDRLEKQVATLETSPLRNALSGFIDDLGLGFGWMAVYFTSFLALMRGQTPGKRLLRMRVVRLDAKPLTWWLCFERFGGYAASTSVGLLGFLQILWDRNRQGLHDKVVETVVIRI
jgi:RDD family protein